MKKVLFSLIAPLCIYGTANAQVLHHDVNPDTTMTNWNAFTPCFMGVAHQSGSKYIDIWVHPTPEVVINTASVEILHDAAGTFPARLKAHDTITPAGKWKPASYAPLNSGGAGNWQTDAADKYLAYRFTDANQKMQYGWIKMTVATDGTSFTVKEWAHTPGKIGAGHLSPTSIQHIVDNNIELIRKRGEISFSNLQSGRGYSVAITGIDGRVAHAAIIQGDETMNISDLASGIYVVRLSGNGSEASFKIAVQQ